MIFILLMIGMPLVQADADPVPIDDIQVYDAAGVPASPYDGQVVTVLGSVYVPQGVFNNGSFYIQGATGGINIYLNFPHFLELGEVVEVQGEVTTFQGTIQIAPNPVILSRTPGPIPEPAIHLPESIVGNYEMVGSFVSVIGEVVQIDSPYYIYLGAGEEELVVYLDATAQLDMNEVNVGDVYRITGPVHNYFGTINIYPRYQEDLEYLSDVVTVEDLTWGVVKAQYR
jgi:hypothetical protein